MSFRILVFYGSYRADRMGIRLAQFVVDGLRTKGQEVELIDAKAIGLPMLDRMYKEYRPGEAPPVMAELAAKIRAADGFVFITGEYNWGMQPGLKNLTDHFLEEWFWRPAGCDCELFGRPAFGGARGHRLARYLVGDGHGRGVEHACCWSDRAGAVGRRQGDGRCREGAGARLPTLR